MMGNNSSEPKGVLQSLLISLENGIEDRGSAFLKVMALDPKN